MVLPIIIGVGATIFALTTKATYNTILKFNKLTPSMIAALNNIRLMNDSHNTNVTKNSHISYLISHYPNSPFLSPMTEQEALLILGIEGDLITSLDDKLVKSRYRSLMMLNHPDKGGSKFLSQKLNQAKDVLEKSYLVKRLERRH